MYCFIEMELSLIVKIKSQAGSQLDRVYSSYLKSVSLCRLLQFTYINMVRTCSPKIAHEIINNF